MFDQRSRYGWVIATTAPAAVIWIRAYVGAVFLFEGIQKFLYPDRLGAGRFDKAGIPAPDFFGPLDGVFEIVCGAMILAGLFIRVAVLPMIVNMLGALLITKLPILWGAAALFADKSGWWDFVHESRTDLAQLCGSVFLLIVGAGAWSPDARLARGATTPAAHRPAG
ncbi:DoxX family protein [Nocardia zapadnayensis]|uniref:DoxX family protein n=1 Tax=Nocardia rhamnosiphila TaxID=426716 RepID=UPI002245B29E|nr:DoxX family protein [Nocardia zapadnayensis]MCX0271567.1 DoxX family protein [Nocardia zapadnayensis]